MHLWPHRGQKLGRLEEVTPVPGARHPHRLESTHTISQDTGWPTRCPGTQNIATVLKQTELLEAVRRGLVPTAVYTLLRTHADDPQATAAHMQRTTVAKTAEQLTYRTHKYLQHAATLPPADQAHLLKLLFYNT